MDARVPGSRRRALDEIRCAIRLARGGIGPSTLVITAGPGVGKTHTLQRLAPSSGASMRWVTADELSWRQPYSVAAGLLGIPLPLPVPDTFGSYLDETADALCAAGPQFFVVDDAHNADASSLQFLSRLSASAHHLPLVITLARRRLPTRELLTRLVTRDHVREWHLPAMDDDDLAALTRSRLGAPPDPALAELLACTGGNPVHALTLLDDLNAGEGLIIDGGVTALVPGSGDMSRSSSLQSAVRGQLALLHESARTLVQRLAVWRDAVTLAELAAIDGTSPASLVGAAQTAVDAGVIVVGDSGKLAFAHDIYADIAYEDVDPALRSVLHGEIARYYDRRGDRQMVAHHLLSSGSGGTAVVNAVADAFSELDNAPAVAADLLDSAVGRLPEGVRSPGRLEFDLATALARSGQLNRSAEVADTGLAEAVDTDTVSRLHRILLFTLTAQGEVDRVRRLVAATLQLPIDEPTRAALVNTQRYVGLLGGLDPVGRDAFLTSNPPTVSELLTEGLRRYLSGDGTGGLELTLSASRLEESADTSDQLSTSAEVWPPLVELTVHGPDAAEQLLTRATLLRAGSGASWMTAYHEFIQGSITTAQGRLDDAAAIIDAGLERAAAAGLGWTSLAEGNRAMIDVYRGEHASALTRLERFAASGLPQQFGLPITEHASVLLLESRRKLRPAARAALRCWSLCVTQGLYGWLPSLGVDFARIALRAEDHELASALVTGLADVPRPIPPARVGPVLLAQAMTCGSPGQITAAALECATAAHAVGNAVDEAAAWEEAACATVAHDKDSARGYASAALQLTQAMGAAAVSGRIASRLRARGLRMDPSAIRHRPRSGWQSLTPTELTITELVAAGRNGNEIAQQLHISRRTVQTHVSHVLTKLGLRTRLEIASAIARRDGSTSAKHSSPSALTPAAGDVTRLPSSARPATGGSGTDPEGLPGHRAT